MTVAVKICGLTTIETMDAAVASGAAYVGLVFYPPSPRSISVVDAVDLAERARGRSKIVALFVDPDDALLMDVIRNVRPDVLQFHGSESPDRLDAIRLMTDASLMKAIKVATREDVALAETYAGHVDMVLFDAKAPAANGAGGAPELPGGNGATFDWSLLADYSAGTPWMLSGGLDRSSVGAAIRATGATAVDVSSGVERARGVKDVGLIAAFVAAAKSSAAAAADGSEQGESHRVDA